ncbi:hypothetical protein WJX72_008166 [[Myrmecia] bisecta]|uniref:Protein phosphatase 1 regulatory subunit 22 n=1 Tax=[Myrmecia] bisecta TaxID=41462 RepID=A0AAW1R8H1_9CHLO
MGPNILEQQQAGVRALTAGERAVFRELCEASGRSEEEVAQQPGCVTVLEMFLHNYPKICCLGLFPALRVLKVAQQTLSKIENLDGCAHLEQLWLTENEICHISGLDRLTKLRQLYLYSNHISRIENLEALTQLEVLWLADNQIRRVEGLARLTNLRELNLARNYIQTVDRHLQPNFRLHTLNLAANDISSFKQVWHLAELLSLRDLSLSDAHWGESPVARLANYRTYVAVNMPHLACLDALDLSATDKAVAQATILKKTMYYNMRIKALQRNTAALQREAQAHKEQLLQPVWDLLKAAHSERSAVRREVEEKQGAEADRCRPHLTQQLHDKLAALETFVAAKEMQVSDVLACWQAGVASSAAECRERVRRMLVELETGGNIRFEEGKPGDSWYQSCLELLAARFVAADMPPALRNTTLRVTGVTRIHNRALRQRFEERVEDAGEGEEGEEQCHLEYLLAAPPPHSAGDLAGLEELYSMSEEAISRLYGMQALHTLTYINLQGNTIRRIEGLEALRSCQVLVLSCNDIQKMEGLSSLTALQRLDLAYNTIKRIEGLKGLDMLSQLDLSGNSISRAEDINVLKKYVPGLARLDLRRTPLAAQRTYPALLLRRLQHLTCLDGRQLSQADWAQAYDSFQSLTPELIRTHATTRRRNVWTGAGPGMLDAWEDPQWWGRVMEVEVGGRCLRRLQNLEHLTDVQRLAFPANELTAIQGMEACTSLTELNLQDNRISCLDGLTCVTQLRVLELGRNLIHHIHGLAILTCLVQLSLEDNQLTSLEGLSRLSSLMELYVSNNQLSKLRQLHALRGLPHLIILDLAGNPLAALPDYRLYTVYHLRKLKVLDSHSIDASEQAVSRTKYAGRLMADFLTDRLGHCFFDRLRELDLAGLAIRDVGDVFAREDWSQLQHLNLDNNDLAEVHGLTALSSLTCLRLCGNRLGEDCSFGGANGDHPLLYNPAGAPLLFPHLSALHLAEAGISNIVALDLSPLTGLRMLDLSGNKLHRVEGLDSLVSLQELLLARNHIKHVDPLALAGLRRLHKLDLSSNGLRSLANLASLTRLHTLHLAGNRISDLAELDRLSALASLQELSLADNLVARKQWYRAILLSKCPTASMVDGHGTVEDHMSFTDEDIREMRAEPLTRSFLRLTKSSERSPDRLAGPNVVDPPDN